MMNALVATRLKEAGRVGARKGMTAADNPFEAGTDMHAAWRAGFDEQAARIRKGRRAAVGKVQAGTGMTRAAKKAPAGQGKKRAAKKAPAGAGEA